MKSLIIAATLAALAACAGTNGEGSGSSGSGGFSAGNDYSYNQQRQEDLFREWVYR